MVNRIILVVFMGLTMIGIVLFAPSCDILDGVQHGSSSSSVVSSEIPGSSASSSIISVS